MSDEIQKVPGAGGTPLAPGAASRFGQKFQQAAQKVTSPMEIPRVFHQLVIFLLDGSGSMTADGRSGRTKGEELHDAMSKVLERLQVSRNKNCFDISCRVYSTEEKQIIAQQSVTQLALDAWSFDPADHIEADETYAATSMEAAFEEARAYLQDKTDKQSNALIILFTDGDFHDEEEVAAVADQIRAHPGVSLATIFYETELTDEWVEVVGADYNENCAEVLRSMATEEADFASTVDPEAIRNHMIKSISRTSQV
ncbi:MAG: VWA domain-containing protein [Flavobacteriales bacterium]|nr:VWA domain-containing protein [Flavobacteriales bacterium]